jgi:hypothetical protein
MSARSPAVLIDGFRGLPHFIQVHFLVTPEIRLRPFLSKAFAIHYLLIIYHSTI